MCPGGTFKKGKCRTPVSSCYRDNGDDHPSVGPVLARRASGLIYGSRTVHTSPGAPSRPGLGPARPGPARRQKVNNGQAAGRCMGGVSGQCPGRAGGLHGFMASWVARNMTGPTVLDQYNNLSAHSRPRCAHSLKIGPLPVRDFCNTVRIVYIRSARLLFLTCFIFYVTKYFM